MKKETPGQTTIDDFRLKQVEVKIRLAEAQPIYSTEQLSSPAKAAEAMAKFMAELDREYCCVVNLNNRLKPINFNIVSIGSINSAQVPVANVFKSAILSNAANIMLLHNHPSSSLTPSREDEKLTKQVIEAGNLMGIPCIDHVIVAGGTGKYYSFRENSGLFGEHGRSDGSSAEKGVSEKRPSVLKKLRNKREEAGSMAAPYRASAKENDRQGL